MREISGSAPVRRLRPSLRRRLPFFVLSALLFAVSAVALRFTPTRVGPDTVGVSRGNAPRDQLYATAVCRKSAGSTPSEECVMPSGRNTS